MVGKYDPARYVERCRQALWGLSGQRLEDEARARAKRIAARRRKAGR